MSKTKDENFVDDIKIVKGESVKPHRCITKNSCYEFLKICLFCLYCIFTAVSSEKFLRYKMIILPDSNFTIPGINDYSLIKSLDKYTHYVQNLTAKGKVLKIKYENINPKKFYLQKYIEENFKIQQITDDDDEEPDYIIVSPVNKTDIHNSHRSTVIISCPEKLVPNFHDCDYAISYVYMDFLDRYLRYPIYLTKNIINKIPSQRFSENNKEFCVIEKNFENSDISLVKIFYEKLIKYKNISPIDNDIKDSEKKINILSNYKFAIIYEPISIKGYTTEKIFEAFAAGNIPIYFGDITIHNFLNSKAFIHIKEENDIDKAIKVIKRIDRKKHLFKKYLDEPIFNSLEYLKREEKKLKEFIFHIFSQDVKNAKRIGRKNH